MTNEQILTDFMQRHYSDEQLAALLAHAEDGKLAFNSCCCFIGFPTRDHVGFAEDEQRIEGESYERLHEWHHCIARETLAEAKAAEFAFSGLSEIAEIGPRADAERREKLIPLIRAEMERRDRGRSKSSSTELTCIEAVSV